MLKLTNVTKIYEMGEYRVNALRGVSIAFFRWISYNMQYYNL